MTEREKMQFVYGFDGNGYGLLYADNRVDAENICVLPMLPKESEVECFGFFGFGENGNRPLFFKCGRSIDGAPYIHGICRDASESYYKDKRAFFGDLFASFIGDEWLSGERGAPISATDEGLKARYAKGECVIGSATCTNIVARILSGESFVLSVPDDIFSNDYARMAMLYIYARLPHDVIKACSFVSGLCDAEGFQIRILPESMAVALKCTVVPICNRDYQPAPIGEFEEMAQSILQLRSDAEKYVEFAAGYRTLCDTYGSEYSPEKLLCFWKAFAREDMEALKQLLADYVDRTPNPNREALPAFVLDILSDNVTALLPEVSVHLLFEPDGILAANDTALRLLYTLDKGGAFVRAIDELYTENGANVFLAMPATVDSIKDFNDNALRYRGINRSNLSEHGRAFYAITDGYFAALEQRIASCIALVQKCEQTKAAIDEELDRKFPSKFNNTAYEDFRKQILHNYNTRFSAEAASLSFDISGIIASLAEQSLVRHNEMFLTEQGADVHYNAFLQCVQTDCPVDELLGAYKKVYDFYGADSDKTKECTRLFILRCEHYGKENRKRIFDAFSVYKGINGAFLEVARENLFLAICSAAWFRFFDDAVDAIVRITKALPLKFDSLDGESFDSLEEIVIDNNLVRMRGDSRFVTAEEFKEYINTELATVKKGDAAKFKKLLLTVWNDDPEEEIKKRNKGKKSRPKDIPIGSTATFPTVKKKDRMLPVIIACIVVAVIIAAIIALFALDAFGDDADTSTLTEISQTE